MNGNSSSRITPTTTTTTGTALPTMVTVSPITGIDYLAAARAPRDNRRRPVGKRRYEIKDIQHRHREIIRMSLAGMKNVAIAATLGITPQNVCDALRSQPIVEEMAKLQEKADERAIDFHKEIKRLVPKALETHEEILTERRITDKGNEVYRYDAPVRQRSADRILDSAGLGRIQRIQGEVVHGFLSHDDIEVIKKRAISRVIDITPSPPSSETGKAEPLPAPAEYSAETEPETAEPSPTPADSETAKCYGTAVANRV